MSIALGATASSSSTSSRRTWKRSRSSVGSCIWWTWQGVRRSARLEQREPCWMRQRISTSHCQLWAM
uniref:Macaca fascicularis brain cDNA clone: QbsB-10144, similar to human kinesin family member 5A (KIF5A), mRNA, RefSeq: NM_004984.2 n=1 Tax=Macaca fascicularis TaxID=9541 RepID=I7GK87_MACFA|nr:unnamed protein product [Macaca fascicularis]